MKLLFTVAAFALALGPLIVVHEYGHYLVARLCGVKVLRFSVGFGRPLLAKKWGPDATEWALAAFPLGGYVKMLDEREGEVAEHEVHRAFNRQPVAKRFAIVLAGPVANFILAIVLYWGLFMGGIPGLKPVMAAVPEGSAAAQAAFHAGDTITRIAGEPVATWQDVRWILLQHAMQKPPLEIETQGAQQEVAYHQLDLSGLGPDDLEGDFLDKLGFSFYEPAPVIGRVVADKPAARAGLQEGDEVMRINERPIAAWRELVREVSQSAGRPLRVDFRRNGAERSVEIIPEAVLEHGKTVGKIGIASKVDPEQVQMLKQKLLTEVRYPPLIALARALDKTWSTSLFSLKMLGKMIVGQVSWKNISGPVTIADYAGQSAQLGPVAYLSFLALISISLGVLNLLPVPLLDGGHLMYYMAEFIKGGPISERAMQLGQQIGIALLFTLMALAFYNDINRLIAS